MAISQNDKKIALINDLYNVSERLWSIGEIYVMSDEIRHSIANMTLTLNNIIKEIEKE